MVEERRVLGPEESVVEGGPRPRLGRALRELWRHRSLILAFAERDIRVKYKQAVLGFAWAIFQPLIFMVIFSFAFGRFARVTCGDIPYRACALSALVPWTFLQGAVAFGANSLLTDAALLRKVYFPRETPVFGAVAGMSIDFGIGLLLFFAIGPFLGAVVSVTWAIAFVLGIGLLVLAAGLALILSSLNVYYRDFRYVVPLGLQIWLFASPVAYPLTRVPDGRLKDIYVVLNPAAGILDSFRRVLAAGQLPDWRLLSISLSVSTVILLFGYRLFKGLERNFADVV